VREVLEELMYERAVSEPLTTGSRIGGGKRGLYESYLEWFPNGPHAADIRAGVDIMEANRASPVISSPQAAHLREGSPLWFDWVTEISETSGHVGFSVSGVGSYISGRGRRLLLTTRYRDGRSTQSRIRLDGVRVGPGGSIRIDRSARGEWFYTSATGRSHNTLCGGRSVFTWSGRDIYGHEIELKEVVNLICD